MDFFDGIVAGHMTISDNVYHKIYPSSEDVPKFHGLPKIHKKMNPSDL